MIEIKSKEKYFFGDESFHIFLGDSSEANSWPLHGHEFFEIELFTAGSGYQILNGERYEIRKGVMHLLTTSDFHEMHWESNVGHIGLRFDRTKIDKCLAEKIFSAKNALVCNLEAAEFKKAKEILSMMHECYKEEVTPLNQIFIKGMLEALIALLLKNFESEETPKKLSNRNHIQQAITYLELNFKNDPGLEEVADYVGLNKNYFSTLFSKVTGKSFVKYMIDLKLEYSKSLIRSSTMTMNEICYDAGFNSFSNFAREFKKKYNCTPLQYRKK
ncbi:MAG: helix-turn-helix domain-containing protein [Clostridia bacterium]|nr:helix-turn-helix domain-containing protein [Clostridia bacterium]